LLSAALISGAEASVTVQNTSVSHIYSMRISYCYTTK
jgi:hypothetical protein